jgi:hypothetical protein
MSTIQYTIRNIPPVVDNVIRKRAIQSGRSFNQTVVDLLSLQTLGTVNPKPDNNFDWLFNKKTLNKSFDETIDNISQIDEKFWR